MNREIINKYSKEFDTWVNGKSVLWRYVGKGEPWYQVKKNGDPFTLDNTNLEYIINDDYVKFRKAIKDGKTIQFLKSSVGCHPCKPHWIDWNSYGEAFTGGPDKYRIKPTEIVYKWKWICRDSAGKLYFTPYYETVEEMINAYNPTTIVERYDPSKEEY